MVNFQWKRSADHSKEVPATFGSEALKELPASEALRDCAFFDYFICNIPVAICNFVFNQIVNRHLPESTFFSCYFIKMNLVTSLF